MDRYPITATQEGIYFDSLRYPGTTIYNIPCIYKLDDSVNMERLSNAIPRVIIAHPYLSATLDTDANGDITVLKNKPARITFTVEKTMPSYEKLVRPFDILSGDPLYHIRLFDCPDGKFLFLDIHHIINDGASISILLEDINTAYEGKPVEPESYTGFDKAVDEKKDLESSRYQEAKAWYDSIFRGCDSVSLPASEKTGSKERIGFYKKRSAKAARVRSFCSDNHISENAFFTAAFGFALKAYTGNESAIFAAIYNGRIDSRLERAVSMFVKTLPVMTAGSPDMSILSFIQDCQSYLVNAMFNDIVSFSRIHDDYGITPDVLFAYQGEKNDQLMLCGALATEVELPSSQTKAQFGVDIALNGEDICYDFEYDPASYSEYTIDGFRRTLENVISGFLEKELLKDIRLTAPEDEEEIKKLYDSAYPVKERPAYRLLQDSAGRYPDRTAVIAHDRSLTYSELNSEANSVGSVLRSKGAAPETIVAVLADRNSYVYVMRQGVLKSGAAFLPIDPEYPEDRIRYILEDAGVKLLLTDSDIAQRRKELFDSLKSDGIQLITVEEAVSTGSSEDVNADVPYGSLAYVIYTSGSTGKPKGVMLTNKNLVNFVDDDDKNAEITGYIRNTTTSLAIAAFTFDFSIMEEFVPLANGMTVVIADKDDIMNPLLISNLITDNHVDAMCCTPGYIMNMLDTEVFSKAVKRIKSVDLGAEAFPTALYGKLTALNPDIHIMNGYGPTEATISCTMQVITSPDNITIGIPNVNVTAATVDRDGRLQIPGSMGELVILGDGVGRGYVGRDDLTAKSFIDLLGQRAYRTGDLVRILSDAQIEYHGRLDNQVKLRGLRVELGEIESVLNSYPGVRSSIVIVEKGQTDYLAAYFTADAPTDIADLKKHLAASLTSYMVPQVFMQLDEMPLTANNKIDKKALPKITAGRDRSIKAPSTPMEELFLDLFRQTLKTDDISVDENFFEIGGTSLTAAKLMMAAMTNDIPIVFQDVFNNPTIEALAKYAQDKIDNQGTDRPAAAAADDKEADTQVPGDINRALKHNTVSFVDEIQGGDPGNVLLTGACGFLGIHVFKELLDSATGRVYCLVHGDELDPMLKLQNTYFYYFSEWDKDKLADRVEVISGDITDMDTINELRKLDFDTVINCAACVKHFAELDQLMKPNVEGVDNLIGLCSDKKARLIQTSTTSVAGDSLGNERLVQTLTENDLAIGQEVESNGYVYTKYLAEKHILEAIADGKLDAKIIRLGNLMSRHVDGEFQINFTTNNFMNTLKSYVVMGCYPIQLLDEEDEFSPIDEVARALLLLSGTNSDFTVFHAYNSHSIEMGDIIYALKDYGFKIDLVESSEFEERLKVMLKDKTKNLYVSPLVNYNLDDDALRNENGVLNNFTVKALYRLGFKWSIIDDEYVRKTIAMLDSLAFFDV